MANIHFQNPESTEIQSPLIAGLSEGLTKISSILNLKTATFVDEKLNPIAIDDKPENTNRIYEIAYGKKLWLQSPPPVFKKDGVVIQPSTSQFDIDYVGGSISFSKPLTGSEKITVSATYIKADSTTVETITNLLNDVQGKAERYKGYYSTVGDLRLAHSSGSNGDIALVASPQFAIYAWDGETASWKNTQSIEDLRDYVKKGELKTSLEKKENSIVAKGDSSSDDSYYYGGRKTWQDVREKVRQTNLTGFSDSDSSPVDSGDTVLSALGKLSGQIKSGGGKSYLEGAGDPVSSTVGKIGQRYVNTSNGRWFTCVGVSGGTYTWKLGLNSELGKTLSSNDFTDEDKQKLNSLENYNDTQIKQDIAKKQDAKLGYSLSQNDYSNEEKKTVANNKSNISALQKNYNTVSNKAIANESAISDLTEKTSGITNVFTKVVILNSTADLPDINSREPNTFYCSKEVV